MNCKKYDEYANEVKTILEKRNRKTLNMIRCDKEFRELLAKILEKNDIDHNMMYCLIELWEKGGGDLLNHEEYDHYINETILNQSPPAHNQDEINDAVLEIVKKSKKGTTLFDIRCDIDISKLDCKYNEIKLATLLLIKEGKISKDLDDPYNPIYFVQKEVISK